MISVILTTCCENDYRLSLLKMSMASLIRYSDLWNKEFIICDNGDERQTEYFKRLSPHRRKDKPDRHLIFGENIGIARARNAGADASTGDYLCFIDGDLTYRPNWLGTLFALLNMFPDRRLIASGIHGEGMRKFTERRAESHPDYQIWRRTGCGCLLMSRETWDAVGPWIEWWKVGTAFCIKANKKKYGFIVPVPDLVRPLDYTPSYDKKKLKMSCINGNPKWKMINLTGQE